jgi:hypothetical protein
LDRARFLSLVRQEPDVALAIAASPAAACSPQSPAATEALAPMPARPQPPQLLRPNHLPSRPKLRRDAGRFRAALQ